jgi:hypothetical protein
MPIKMVFVSIRFFGKSTAEASRPYPRTGLIPLMSVNPPQSRAISCIRKPASCKKIILFVFLLKEKKYANSNRYTGYINARSRIRIKAVDERTGF